jgi:Ku protein
MRTIWNGSITFGLVSIPIGLAVAQQRKDVSFRTLHRECGTPIKQKRWCPVHERDVEADELVKGWEFAKGQFVIVEDEDLEKIALQRSQSVDIVTFVPMEQVDPIYFDRTYYLAPASAEAQRRPYVLLLEAMRSPASARSASSSSGTRRTSASSGRSATRSRSRRSTSPRTSGRAPRSRRRSARARCRSPSSTWPSSSSRA